MRIYAVFVLLAVLPYISLASLNEYNVDISINEDKSTNWIVRLEYSNITAKSDYFIFGIPTNLEITGDGRPLKCAIGDTIRTSIVCNNANARSITYKFTLTDSVGNIGQLSRFSYKFSATQFTDRFSANIKLPLGAALVENSRLSGTGLQRFEPSFGREGSDGRKIYIEWISTTPKLGETYDISVIFEGVSGLNVNILPFIGIIAALLAVIAGFVLYTKKFRVHSRDILPVLSENERKVMEILFNERKDVDQRKIIKDTDFSKPKVSRIIHDLCSRGLIEKVPKGRTNIIRLKKQEKSK